MADQGNDLSKDLILGQSVEQENEEISSEIRLRLNPRHIESDTSKSQVTQRKFIENYDLQNNRMETNFETEFTLNKFVCPNDHPLFVKTCSCDDIDISKKNIVLSCEQNCDFNNFRSLDCGRSDCAIYDR